MFSRARKRIYEQTQNGFYFEKNKQALGLALEEYLRLKRFEHWHVVDIETLFYERPFKISSPYWFLQSIDEIFVQEVYKFETSKLQPVIIDCGASWGLSVVYFKFKFPESVLLAYEADHDIYETALSNLNGFGFDHLTLHNMALWDTNGSLVFSSEGSVGGSVADLAINASDLDYAEAPPDSWIGNYNTYFGIHKTTQRQVEAVRLRHILETFEVIDFLKIDIEGAEHRVIMDCAGELHRVEKMFIEYHSVPNQPQLLDNILRVVSNSGFRYYIKEASNNFTHPFIRDKDVLYDLQLNIFCFR